MSEMVCEICGRTFVHVAHGRLKYCSVRCAEIGYRTKKRECEYYLRRSRKPKVREIKSRGVYRPADVPVEDRMVNGVRMQCRGRCCGAVGARRLLDGGW